MEDKATSPTSEHILAIVGAELAEARRQRGLRQSDIAERLRILPEHITAIEQGNLSLLPSITYVIGYVRSYANLVGADGSTLCRMLRDSLSENEMKPDYAFVQDKARPNTNAGFVAAGALVVCLLAYSGWYIANVSPSAPQSEIQLANTTPEETEALLSATDITELEENTGQVSSPSVISAQPTVAGVGEPAPENTLTAGTGTAQNTDIQGVTNPAGTNLTPEMAGAGETPLASDDEKLLSPGATEPADTAAVSTTATQAMAVGRVPDQEMTIRAVATSWVEITRADGSRVSAWLMKKDESYTIPGGDDLYLTTGNAGGLEIMLGQDETFLLGAWGETLQELPLDKSLIKNRL